MPDWTYQTVFRPLLARLNPQTARDLALGAMGALARLPLGTRVIQLMGHMDPDPRLAIERDGIAFPSPFGLSCRFDPHLAATPALAEFGFGFIEIGPIVANPPATAGPIHVDAKNKTILLDAPQAALTPAAARQRLEAVAPIAIPIFARIHPETPEEAREMVAALAPLVAAFIAPVDRLEMVNQALADADDQRRPLYAAVTAEIWLKWSFRDYCAGAVVTAMPRPNAGHELSKRDLEVALLMIPELRAVAGHNFTIIAAVGVHQPADALDYLAAGADLVQLDAGLVFAGPGLPKRINEAVLYHHLASPLQRTRAPHNAHHTNPRPATQSWFWAFLMGAAMLAGGLMAMAIAATRIVLPYDEAMVGLTRQQLALVNCRLLPFMQHDRVTLAGTMLAVGVLYIALARWGIRRGVHWAYAAVVASAFAGFFSFFSFLGFGYFDPFHAFVTAVLFQFLLLTMLAGLPPRHAMEPPSLHNDRPWRLSQWGQLMFVVHGVALVVAGLTISAIGMTTVFVPEDLEFMETTAEELIGAHPRLVPLVAHDRATFGGMLIATGIATLLPAMWGFARGQAWLWWALMIAGTVAYSATMMVHWTVGYHSLKHLLPAIGGLAWLWLGGALSYGYVAAPDPALEAQWKQRLAAASPSLKGRG